jgi:hypothetical protein
LNLSWARLFLLIGQAFERHGFEPLLIYPYQVVLLRTLANEPNDARFAEPQLSTSAPAPIRFAKPTAIHPTFHALMAQAKTAGKVRNTVPLHQPA